MIICITGLGLIGGSMATDLKRRGFARHIIGVDNNTSHCEVALQKGLVDEVLGLDEGVKKADLIILSTPVDVLLELLPLVLDLVAGSGKVVTDTGSTKLKLGSLVNSHPGRKCFVAGHPMAGTEQSGPSAAISGLFDNKCVILCDPEKSDIKALNLVERMYSALNMEIIYMQSSSHDVSAAYVSHISHIASFALSLCVQEKEQNEKRIFSLAGGGFSSTVRLAASASSMWTPILSENAPPVLEALDAYIHQLSLFRDNIASRDISKLNHLIGEANKIQQIINLQIQ
ncbi:MAG: prephenate dehydrogenase [Bacteroidia bacterium]|nr:MAG: prephenate dehydrogenase [Bacteroidia bacterium]